MTKHDTIARRPFLLLAAAALFALLAPAGCGDKTASTDTTGGVPPTTPAAPGGPAVTTTGGGGQVVIKGSDTLLPLAQQWAEGFKAKNPNADLTVTGGGSSTGITALISGTCDIADASRPIKNDERDQAKAKNVEVKEFAVARDGITIVVHPSNPVKSLTVEQVAGIYTGKVNNWKEIGGPDQKIVASGRDASSGTYGYFQEDVLKKARYRADMISTPSNNQIATNVAEQPGGIGYIGVAYASAFTKAGKVKEVPIAFKAGDAPLLPTPENILSGKYPISRALLNYTNGEPKGVVKEYLDYVTGPEGQAVVEKVGFVPVKKG